MARARKEARKVSPEERLQERWTQQVFFLSKYFPESKNKVNDIQKRHKSGTKSASWVPNEMAVEELVDLYYKLKIENPSRMVTITQAAVAASLAAGSFSSSASSKDSSWKSTDKNSSPKSSQTLKAPSKDSDADESSHEADVA